jgi:HD-GYP domain-containing protein (c-di-GMP phosphodiesterase class II)/putative methionine-R-sulfoxide reductase with GAF domain
MLDLMRVAGSSLDLDEVNLTILGHLMQLIPSDAGTIQLLKGDRLQVSAATGFPPGTIARGTRFLLDDYPVNQEVIEQKHSVRIGNNSQDERYRVIPGVPSFQSMMAIPIIFGDNAIGMATLDSFQLDRFTAEHEELAMAVATNVANAIGNARLFELEQHGRQQAENLRLAASAVTSSLDPQQVLETILTALKQVLHYDSASILLLEGDQVRITAAQGLPNQEDAINRTYPAENGLLMAIAANNNQPVILYDAQVDPRFGRWAGSENVRGWMGVPLSSRGEIVGYITLDSYNVGSFDENAAALAQTFAYQAAAAIDNARLYQETRKRLEEMEVVGRVSFALRATQDPDEMLPVLLQEVLKVMKTEAASIWLYEPARNHLDQKVVRGWKEQAPSRHHLPNESIAIRVFRSGEVALIDELPNSPDQLTEPVSEGTRGWSGVGVPIRTSTQTIGAMLVGLPLPRRIEPAQIQLLTTLAEIAGNAIHRAQLYDQSEEQVRKLTALRDVDTAIASSFDLRVTLNILLDHTLSQLRADAAAIFSYNPEMRTLGHIASLGFRESGGIQANLRISGRMLNDALLERKNIHVEHIADEPLFYRKEIATREKFISYYATPLISKGQVKGILEIYYRQPHPPEMDWMDFFQTMAGQAAIAIDNSQLFDNLQRSNQELSLAYDTTLEGWGKALELRDKETQGHTVRVTDLTLRLARRMNVPEADLIHIRRGVLLHDIGKMAVPDNILKKTGPLDEKEWEEMRMHPQSAYDLLYPITYLRPAVDIPYCHHERWDGEGYPNHLKGEEIPLSARIFAIIDVWDALLYDRPYRKAWPRQKVIDYIRGETGTRFEPRVGAEFLRMVQEEDLKAE